MEKTLGCEIVTLNNLYRYAFTHFLKFFVLIQENTFENKKFDFLTKICEIWKKTFECESVCLPILQI